MADNEENGTGDEGASGENQNADEGKNAEGNQNDGGDAGGESGKAAVSENWYGDDWRTELAGDDEKLLTKLGRFNDPKGMLTAYQALEQKMNEGAPRGELPEKYTDAELATYREANGIPEKAEGYFTDMPDGLVIGDEDKELFSDFGKAMHDLNVKPEVTNGVAAWYYDMQEKEQAAQVEADEGQRMATEDSLRVKYGDEYRAVISTLDTYLEGAGDEVMDLLTGARAGDGTPLMTKPGVLEFFADRAREENPWTTPVPNEGDATSMAEEKAKLLQESAFDNSPYHKGPKDANGNTAGQNRMLKIIEQEKRMEGRAV